MKSLRKIIGFGCLALCLGAGMAQAATVIWADSFETNVPPRWTNSSPWQIGKPTAGPPTNSLGYRAFSGTNCASTQKYAKSADGRLVCTNYNGHSTLTVPPSSKFPRLRFWEWFNFTNALGFVEISTNAGGSWVPLAQTNLDVNSGGVWSRPYLDLSAYAGQPVQIAFHFTAGGYNDNSLGWFVDDVEVDTGTPGLTFPEGFEFDPKMSDWSVDYGTWQIGKPTSGPPTNSLGYRTHAGTNCAATVLATNYAVYADTRLISPPFVVPPTNSPALRFWEWYNFNNAQGFVEINNGSITTVSTTNVTIVTNAAGTLNTNIYQFSDAAISGYTTPLYWNAAIGGWTNSTQAMGWVTNVFGQTNFAAGFAPLASVGQYINGSSVNIDYEATNVVVSGPGLPGQASSSLVTNFLQLQGVTWYNPNDTADAPVGYFGTNYTYTYTTNQTVIAYNNNWTTISPTNTDNASWSNGVIVWTNTVLDLSAYEGQLVRVAFHFQSGGYGAAPGWYVDDLSLDVPPVLIVPTNATVNAGGYLDFSIYPTNIYVPNVSYTITLVSEPAGASALLTPDGFFSWHPDLNWPTSTNIFTVEATDSSLPPLSVTTSFSVVVTNQGQPILIGPTNQTIYAGQTVEITCSATNEYLSDDAFTFSLLLPAWDDNLNTNDLPVDGILTWTTDVTTAPGDYTNAVVVQDQRSQIFATNSFVITVLSPPNPTVSVPSSKELSGGQTLNIFITAANSAFPSDNYQYTITNSPPGVSIDQDNGELTWTTAPTNNSWSTSISVIATDTANGLTGSGRFSVAIYATPNPKVTVPAFVTNYPGQAFAITNITATNAGILAAYTFSLLPASTNMFITNNGDASAVLTWTNTGIMNGILTWTNEPVAPGRYTNFVEVRDNTNSWLGAGSNRFVLVFLPPPPPSLNLPASETNYVGQTFSTTLSATNYLPLAQYTFSLASDFPNGTLQGNVLTWTNTAAAPGSYTVSIAITDNSVPPLVATNDVTVTLLLPLPAQLNLANPALAADGSGMFQFNLPTQWTNLSWRIEATTNLAAPDADWLPVYTNQGGSGSPVFTDVQSTNFPQRYYRVVYP